MRYNLPAARSISSRRVIRSNTLPYLCEKKEKKERKKRKELYAAIVFDESVFEQCFVEI